MLREADSTPEEAEAIYRLTSLCTFEERFVIPPIAPRGGHRDDGGPARAQAARRVRVPDRAEEGHVIPARLFAYPGEDYQALAGRGAGVRPTPSRGMSVEDLQELYTRTFDWNPDTSLEIGWHLYGENYERGEFLVEVRAPAAAPRHRGIAKACRTTWCTCCRCWSACPRRGGAVRDANTWRRRCEKIEAALAGTGNPYLHLVSALAPRFRCGVRTPRPPSWCSKERPMNNTGVYLDRCCSACCPTSRCSRFSW